MYEDMELYIETLTGTAFRLIVSSFETVQDIKARIQKMEGIPISEQHLIWQSKELEDESDVSDCGIHDGAKLKLVLAMRGGPVNTMRIPRDYHSMREMMDYYDESDQDELYEKVSDGSASVIFYYSGDQLSFIRVVERECPMSEEVNAACMHSDIDNKRKEVMSCEQLEENDKTKAKMNGLRLKMQNLSIGKREPKKKVLLPHHPIRQFSSGSDSTSKSTLECISSAKRSLHHSICLPPVRQKSVPDSLPRRDDSEEDFGSLDMAKTLFQSAASAATSSRKPGIHTILRKQVSVDSSNSRLSLCSIKEDKIGYQQSLTAKSSALPEQSSDTDCDSGTTALVDEYSDDTHPEFSKESILKSAQSSLKLSSKRRGFFQDPKPMTPHMNESKLDSASSCFPNRTKSSSIIGHDRLSADTLSIDNILSRQRTVSGGLRQSANIVRTGTILNSVDNKDHRYFPTQEDKLSGRPSDISAYQDDCVISRAHHLPPVKQKKKLNRCLVCHRKTGLANSYYCRCSRNFCATHRYPEAHSCTFDYKTEGRKLIEQNNPLVNAPKLPQI